VKRATGSAPEYHRRININFKKKTGIFKTKMDDVLALRLENKRAIHR
jgi:hypothetical protein